MTASDNSILEALGRVRQEKLLASEKNTFLARRVKQYKLISKRFVTDFKENLERKGKKPGKSCSVKNSWRRIKNANLIRLILKEAQAFSSIYS